MRSTITLLFLPSILFAQAHRPFDLGECVYNSFEFFGAGYIVPGPTLTPANAAKYHVRKMIADRDSFMNDPHLGGTWYQLLFDSSGHCTDYLAGNDNYHYEYDNALRKGGIYRLSLIRYQAYDAGEALTPDSVKMKYDSTGRLTEVDNYSVRLAGNFITPLYDDVFITYGDSGNILSARATGRVGNWLWEYKYDKLNQVLSFDRPSYLGSYDAKKFYHCEFNFAPVRKRKKNNTAQTGLRNGLDLLDTIPSFGIFSELFLPADSFTYQRDELHRVILIRDENETCCTFSYNANTGLPASGTIGFGDENRYRLKYRYEYQ